MLVTAETAVHGLWDLKGAPMTTDPHSNASVDFTHVQPGEVDRAIATLVLSFAADPHLRWLFPDAGQYLIDFPDVLQSFAGVAFAGETVWKLDGLSAVALWLPPGGVPDTDAAVAAFAADGVTVQQFNEPAGGQMVFHTHFHVMPRHRGVELKPHSGKMADPKVLAANAEKIRAALARA